MPDEEEIVEMIKNWRVREENTPDHNDTSGKKGEQSSLKKDNVAPEEVVDIIKDYRTTNKIKYVQYQESTHDGSLINKFMEVKDIFDQTSNEMEWEKINTEALKEIARDQQIETLAKAKTWALDKNNFFHLGQRIISLAEQTKIFKEYTTLNDNFKQRLENENRYHDEKKTGEKRPMCESPTQENEPEDSDEEDKNGYISDTEDEIREDVEIEKEEPTTSPSQKKKGEKKKNNNKKKF
ncbi:hypothetical protein RhiirB3_431107 [Rhizophagus irregularis]|nr:hypothetical protein RhiirB3_431107 [Rhizophagus irregularis]